MSKSTIADKPCLVQTPPFEKWNSQTPLQTAIEAARLYNFSVFPLASDKKPPIIPGKFHDNGEPMRLGWKKYQKEAAREHNITWWQQNFHPTAYALVTGKISNRVILDFDGEAGKETLQTLGLQPHVKTGSGGYHVHFKHPGWHVPTLNSKSKKELGERWPGLDIRGDGGYAAFCGSNEKGQYQWLRDPAPDELDILPDNLREFLNLLYAPNDLNAKARRRQSIADTCLKKYIQEAAFRGRDNACFELALQLRDNHFSESEAETIALEFARSVHSTDQKGAYAPFTDSEARAKVASAYSRGAREPWTQSSTIGYANKGSNYSGSKPPVGLDLCSFDADDSGNADAMFALFGDRYLWCSSRGWFQFTGTHWELDTDGAEIKKSAVETLRRRRHAAVDAQKEAIVKCTKADTGRVEGCVSLFKIQVSVSIDEFDTRTDALNCKNGVVNLRTGDLEPHCKDQRFTYCLPIEYRKADFEKWLDYLNGVVGGGQEVIDYLQIALGYSLTGSTREEILFYLYGPTRSGKGTIAETFMALMPTPLSKMVDFNSFTAKREGDVSNFDLAPLKPARMIFASESNRSQSLNPAKIKQLTGGDHINACFKHKDFFSFRPQFKVWMMSNHPVNGDPEDDALWGRVRVIEFPNSFLGKEDKSKKEGMKDPEQLQAVLYWTVQGAIKWYALGAQGLTTPSAIMQVTQSHRNELDYVQQWLEERSDEDETGWASNEAIMGSYSAWCKNNNVQYPKGPKALAQSLKAKGYQIGIQKKVNGVNKKGVVGLYLYPMEG